MNDKSLENLTEKFNEKYNKMKELKGFRGHKMRTKKTGSKRKRR